MEEVRGATQEGRGTQKEAGRRVPGGSRQGSTRYWEGSHQEVDQQTRNEETLRLASHTQEECAGFWKVYQQIAIKD